MTELRGPRVVLRAVAKGDLPRLREILREPEVARHWSSPGDDDEFLAGEDPDGAEKFTTFVISVEDDAIGWLGAWEKLEPEYRHAGIDLFITARQHGKGYGPEAIRLACAWLFDDRGHHRITIDPAASNVRAIAAYEKVGFKRVGVLRAYERGTDGTFHDGVLLDMLRSDLR